MVVISDVVAAQVGILSVTDEVTNTIIEDRRRAVWQDIQVALISEIAEGRFVLSNNQRHARKTGVPDNAEVVGDAHATIKKNTAQKSRC